jgi:hypothetical protein
MATNIENLQLAPMEGGLMNASLIYTPAAFQSGNNFSKQNKYKSNGSAKRGTEFTLSSSSTCLPPEQRNSLPPLRFVNTVQGRQQM